MSKQKLTNTELTTKEVYENLGTGLGEMHKGGRFEPVNDIPTLPSVNYHLSKHYKGLCALITHIDYFFIALFDDFKLIISICLCLCSSF
jgi:hypothetical protein